MQSRFGTVVHVIRRVITSTSFNEAQEPDHLICSQKWFALFLTWHIVIGDVYIDAADEYYTVTQILKIMFCPFCMYQLRCVSADAGRDYEYRFKQKFDS